MSLPVAEWLEKIIPFDLVRSPKRNIRLGCLPFSIPPHMPFASASRRVDLVEFQRCECRREQLELSSLVRCTKNIAIS